MTRYFIVVYQYQMVEGSIGQGSCTVVVSGGVYFSLDEIKKAVKPNIGGEIKTFLLLNAIELNKGDFKFYKENNTLEDES
jgi:hypothetical protein